MVTRLFYLKCKKYEIIKNVSLHVLVLCGDNLIVLVAEL